MTTVARPNRIALNNVLDIYRDAMRPFIIRCLRRVPGQQIEDVIRDSLNERQGRPIQPELAKEWQYRRCYRHRLFSPVN